MTTQLLSLLITVLPALAVHAGGGNLDPPGQPGLQEPAAASTPERTEAGRADSDAPRSTQADPPPPSVDPQAVRDLVTRLGSSDYADRQSATLALVNLGTSAFDILVEEYLATDDYEIRLRVQDVIEKAFFDEYLFNRNGFLGVRPMPVGPAADPRVPPGHTGLELMEVVEHHAAARAGLSRGDLIVGINGKPLGGTIDGASFSKIISDAGPGTILTFSIYRGTRRLSVEVTLGPRPLEYYNEPNYEAVRALEDTARRFQRWWRENIGQPPD